MTGMCPECGGEYDHYENGRPFYCAPCLNRGLWVTVLPAAIPVIGPKAVEEALEELERLLKRRAR